MKEIRLLLLFIFSNILSLVGQDTFSIVAVDPFTGEVGSAGASCVDLDAFAPPTDNEDFLAELFPGLGSINTQGGYHPVNQENARSRMNMGEYPDEIINWLVENDILDDPTFRQYGIIALKNGTPYTSAYTGANLDDYKSHLLGWNYSIQGNVLLGSEIIEAMEQGFLNTEGDLACKLMGAMKGANIIGADARCQANGTSSLFAFLKVAQPTDSFGYPSFLISVRTKKNTGVEPIDSLQILFDEAYSCYPRDIFLQGSGITVYPNLSINSISVELHSGQYFVRILDFNNNIYENITITAHHTIDLSSLPPGLFFLEIENQANTSTYLKKIIKP